MTLLFALFCALPAQETADDLRKEVEKLKVQNRDLQDRLAQLEESAVRDAEKIQRLRSAIKSLETVSSAAPTPKPADGIVHRLGPTEVIKGRVIHVEPKFNFLLIDLGKDRKLQPGYKFDILRKVYEKDNPDPRLQKIGAAEFEKYIGDFEESSKLKVVEGTTADMKVEDDAVAIRALAVKPPKVEEMPQPPKNGVYKITGLAGRGLDPGFMVNYGSVDGAKQSAVLFLYKDGVFKAKLRVDTVMKEFSIANLIAGSLVGTAKPEIGDQAFTRELQKSVSGKVALVDDKAGRVATDLRERDGIKPGHRLEIRRLGQRIGTLIVTDVQQWGSWAKPEGETKLDGIQKGDFVEAVEEK
ncbi:MAG TPA: hypothetical protein VJB14_07410 [Planctomycetota bacterium]|nr:hypothetical protein [Planctomycetota bacterium]